MKWKWLIVGCVLAGVPLLSGCASIINGSHQTVGVSSSPIGAKLTVDGMTYSTPAMVKLRRNRDHIIVFEKQGYEGSSGTVTSEFNPLIFANILWYLGAPIAFGVDLATGSSYNLEPSSVHMTLQPAPGSPRQ